MNKQIIILILFLVSSAKGPSVHIRPSTAFEVIKDANDLVMKKEIEDELDLLKDLDPNKKIENEINSFSEKPNPAVFDLNRCAKFCFDEI